MNSSLEVEIVHVDLSYVSLPAIVARRASETPSEPFLAWGDSVISYAGCAEAMVRTAAGLARKGVRPGVIVASFLSTRRDTVKALLAVSAVGGILAPFNRWVPPRMLRPALTRINPDWLIADETASSLLDRLEGVLPPRSRWIAMPGERGSNSWVELEATRAEAPVPELTPDHVCYLDFTSGSSGTPKAVPRTYRSIWAITWSAAAALGLQHHDRHLSLFAPFAHPHEALARAAYLGGVLVMTETLRPSAIATAVARHCVTCIMAVPTVFGLLADWVDDPRFATVRLFESGGAVTPEPLIETYRRRRGVPLTPVWGCTEAGGIALAGRQESRPEGAVGTLCPGFEARLVSIDTSDGGPEHGEPACGELVLRGDSLATEYYGQPEETVRSFRDGWYFTGDIFSRDEEGFYSFRGRADDMIKVRGLKVFTGEVERVLMLHPSVAEAAVVARDDSHPVAYVVARPGARLQERALRAFCKERLPSFAVPRVVVRSSLPKTRSGKILKRGLGRARPR